MRKIIYSLSLALMLFGSAKGQVITSDIEWQRCYGGSHSDFAVEIKKTEDGGYAVVGWAQSNDGEVIGLHEGNNTTNYIDTWFLKLDSLGNIQWQRTLGGYTHEPVYTFDYTTDNGFIIAIKTNSINSGDIIGNHSSGDIWLIKLDSIGETEWERYFEGSGGDYAHSILQTDEGGYILFGSTFSNDGDFSGLHGGNDYWVAKLDSIGEIEWEKCLGGTDSEYLIQGEIIQTANGDFLFCGATESNDGDVSGNHGQDDAWLVKLNAQGDIIWQRCYGGSLTDNAHSVSETSDNGYVFTGYTLSNDFDVSGNHSNADIWVVKTDINGTIEWQKCLGGSNFENIHSIIEGEDGSLLLAGSAISNDGDVSGNHGSADVWLVKLKPMILNFDSINNTSCTVDDGSIDISIFGGTPPYSYSWDTNPIQTTEDISDLPAGVYTVTVTDAEGITVTGSALINGPSTFNGTDLAGHFTTTVFRPGLTSQIFIDVTNQGCFPLDGTVVFVLDPWLNYVDAVPPPDSISGDSVFWHLDALTYDSLHFTPVVTVTTDLTAQIGDSICLELTVYPFETDGDNLQTMCYPVVNSYDPNDKQVSPQGFSEHGFIASNQRMYYTVRFQNTGNAEALDVYILDTLDANLDFQTLQVYSSSHTMTTELLPDNVVKFRFDDIHLPDSNANEPASHGYVMYEIDQLPDLAVDTEIKNTAYIYFDFNPPVITNTVLNTIYDCSSSFNEPFITASGPLTFCDGENITLDAGAGYDEYEWSNGETTQSISIDTTGDYSVAVRVDTCWHYSDTVELEAHTFEVPVSENGQLLISDSAFVSYQWYLNGEPIINAVYQTHCAQEFGNYFVVVTDDYGCTDTSHVIEHGINTPPCDIGINEPENTFTIYPNPATTELTIVGYNPASLKLCNTLGQTVTEAYNTNKLQIAELSKGLYLLQVFDESGALLKTEKVVKK